MIYRHKHLKTVFLEQKQVKQITQQQPLIAIVEDSSFLHYTFKTSLQYLGIPHLLSTLKHSDLEGHRKNMDHEVPALVFGNQVLETNQSVQFLCDAFIDHDQFIDFQSRKAVVKEMVATWKEIFIFEKCWPDDFAKLKHLGVSNKRDYKNLILQQLSNLHINYEGKVLQKAYSKYSVDGPYIQNIIFVDIIDTILKQTPESYADYYLRKHYQNLIELKKRLTNTIKDFVPRVRMGNHEIVLEFPQKQNDSNWENFRFNYKNFLVLFGFMGTMYGIFAKP